MSVGQALILGIVQGLTEFIPVSSSGHLVLLPAALGWQPPSLAFDVVLHLGTAAAMLAVFGSDLIVLGIAWLRSVLRKSADQAHARVAWYILLATVPAGILYVLLDDWFESLFGNPLWVAVFLLFTGGWLWFTERLGRSTRQIETLRGWEALGIGLAQGLALAPGVSRSGATMGTGLLLGLRREAAARFAFLLAMPAILGAGLVKLVGLADAPVGLGLVPGAVGFVAAAVSGYLCIRFLLSYLRTRTLIPFAVYCWMIGLVSIVWLIAR